ncbi:alpha/beta hydrolase [Paenibacillus sp. CC-CFT747]|nr:alpha/beta hydrolase [Paenibacillus sp. CC-CFT747]
MDYRNGSDEGFTPLQAIADVKSAVRWVRTHSAELQADPSRVAVCGASAGGYITVSSILFPEVDDAAPEEREVEAVPNELVIFAAGMDAVDIMGRRYPEILDQAREISPLHHIRKALPRTLWLLGTSDDLYEQNMDFVRGMRGAGNDITLETYEGMEHGFFNYGRHDNKPWRETTLRIESFLYPDLPLRRDEA